MVRIEKFIFSVIIGSVFPLLFLLFGTAMWFYYFKYEINIETILIPLALISLVIYVLFIHKWKMKIYDLPIFFLVLVYLVFNIGMFGLFMGFPAFNLFWGVVAGYYYGKRLKHLKLVEVVQLKHKERVAIFTSLIMLLICIATGLIVLIDKYIGADLQNMLSIESSISRPLISGITVLGGIVLTISQYFVTLITLNKVLPSNRV